MRRVGFCEGEAAVQPANIVGYETVTVESGSGHTFSLCLADIANPTQPVRIDKLFSSMEGLKGSSVIELDETIDQIWAFTGYVWRKYGYTKTGKGATAVYAWKQWKNEEWIQLTDTDKVGAGEGFLYYHNDSDDAAVVTFKPLQAN